MEESEKEAYGSDRDCRGPGTSDRSCAVSGPGTSDSCEQHLIYALDFSDFKIPQPDSQSFEDESQAPISQENFALKALSIVCPSPPFDTTIENF